MMAGDHQGTSYSNRSLYKPAFECTTKAPMSPILAACEVFEDGEPSVLGVMRAASVDAKNVVSKFCKKLTISYQVYVLCRLQ